MNCLKLLKKCKAECCGPCPFPKALYWRNYERRKRQPAMQVEDEHGFVHAVGENGRCIFNDPEDFTCAIYDDRPPICHEFGNGTHPLLVCPWQAPDGRVRRRGERRQVEREIGPIIDRKLRALEKAAKNSEHLAPARRD